MNLHYGEIFFNAAYMKKYNFLHFLEYTSWILANHKIFHDKKGHIKSQGLHVTCGP